MNTHKVILGANCRMDCTEVFLGSLIFLLFFCRERERDFCADVNVTRFNLKNPPKVSDVL